MRCRNCSPKPDAPHHDPGVAASDDGAGVGDYPQRHRFGRSARGQSDAELESYFLEVVEKAKQSRAADKRRPIRCARGGISAGRRRRPLRPDKVLEKLTLPTAATPAPVAAKPAEPAVNEKKLDALTKSEPAPAPSQPTPTQQAKAEGFGESG